MVLVLSKMVNQFAFAIKERRILGLVWTSFSTRNSNNPWWGYSGDNCQVASDPCASNPCLNGATCASNGVASFTCSCAPNWTGQTCDRPLGECGGVREEEKGSIAYPGGDFKYPSNAKCSWTILAPGGFTIQLSFSKFDLEPKTG